MHRRFLALGAFASPCSAPFELGVMSGQQRNAVLAFAMFAASKLLIGAPRHVRARLAQENPDS